MKSITTNKLFALVFLLMGFTAMLFSCQKTAMEDGLVGHAAKPSPTTKMSTPTITCAGSSRTEITLSICAGTTGAPAGFSVQWMTAAAYALGPDGIAGTADDNSWYASNDERLCKASFSGNANNSNYNLTAGQCREVTIGNLLLDNGVSTNCGVDDLVCATDYVFRAFAHANNSLQRSDFTANKTCATAACVPPTDNCSFSQGYWFNSGSGQSNHSWMNNSVTLGGESYTEAEGRAIKAFMLSSGGSFGSVRQAFLQSSAIQISFATTGQTAPADVQAQLDIIDAFFAGLPRLAPGSVPTATDAAVTAAAAYLSQWIYDNHC